MNRSKTRHASLWSNKVAFKVWGIKPPDGRDKQFKGFGMMPFKGFGMVCGTSLSVQKYWTQEMLCIPSHSLFAKTGQPSGHLLALPLICLKTRPVRKSVVSLKLSVIAMAPCCLFFGSNSSWQEGGLSMTIFLVSIC